MFRAAALRGCRLSFFAIAGSVNEDEQASARQTHRKIVVARGVFAYSRGQLTRSGRWGRHHSGTMIRIAPRVGLAAAAVAALGLTRNSSDRIPIGDTSVGR